MDISAISQVDVIKPTINLGQASQSEFQQWLENSLGSVNSKLVEADHQLQTYALGESNNIHQVMLAIQSAKLEFQLMVEVRNRILEGYQELSRMQI